MPKFLYEFNDLLQGVIKHLIRVLNRILYCRCCATYRPNTWHASPRKIWFQMLRNALQRPCFCKWKDDICEGPGLKCTNSIWRPHFKVVETLRSITIVRLVCGPLKEERYIAKATNSQYFTKSFTQKNVLLFALILTNGSIRFDSRNTYRVTGVTGYGFNWEPCLCWLTHKRNKYHSPCEGSTCWKCRYIMSNTVLHPGYFSCTDLGKSCQRWSC